VLLGLVVAVQLVQGQQGRALVAAVSLALTLVPAAVGFLSGWHVPPIPRLIFVRGITFQFASESSGVYDLVPFWDKVVHPLEMALAARLFTWLLLGYRELRNLEIPDNVLVASAVFFGISLGVFWEGVEFMSNWLLSTHHQKSNLDTMTDLFVDDGGVLLGTVLFFWLYRHRTAPDDRCALENLADWLTPRSAALLNRRCALLALASLLIAIGMIAASVRDDRVGPPPREEPPAAHPSQVEAVLRPAQVGARKERLRLRRR
jgi:hypothetical protein